MVGTTEILSKMMNSIGRSQSDLKIIENTGIFTLFLTKGTPLDDLYYLKEEEILEIVRKEYFEFRSRYRSVSADISRFFNSFGYHSELRFKLDDYGNFVIMGRVISGEATFETIGTLSRVDITNLLNKWIDPDGHFTLYADNVVSKSDSLSFKVYTRTLDGKTYFSRDFKVIPYPCGKIEYIINEDSYFYETNNVVEKIALLGEALTAWFKLGVGIGEEITTS